MELWLYNFCHKVIAKYKEDNIYNRIACLSVIADKEDDSIHQKSMMQRYDDNIVSCKIHADVKNSLKTLKEIYNKVNKLKEKYIHISNNKIYLSPKFYFNFEDLILKHNVDIFFIGTGVVDKYSKLKYEIFTNNYVCDPNNIFTNYYRKVDVIFNGENLFENDLEKLSVAIWKREYLLKYIAGLLSNTNGKHISFTLGEIYKTYNKDLINNTIFQYYQYS